MGDFSICFSEHLTGHPINLMTNTLYIIVYVILCIAIITHNEYVLHISEKNGEN